MKTLLIFLAVLAISLPAFAQTERQVEAALSNVLLNTGRSSGSIPIPYAGVSAGVIGLNGKLALKTATDGSLVVTNPTNDFVFTLDLPAPSANRTISFPIGGGTVVTTPTTLEWQFTGATYNTVLTQVEPTVGDTVITFPDTANVDVAIPLSTLTTNSLTAANSVWLESSAIAGEGATADAHESRITFADPTGDVVYPLLELAVGTYPLVYSTLSTNKVGAANSVWLASNSIVGEGTTADTSETTVSFGEPTADRTVTLPDATGTAQVSQASTAVSLTADNQAVAPAGANVIQLASDNATATNRTFTLTTTGAVAGEIYVLIGPATNQCEIAVAATTLLSATWSPTTADTLTLLFNGTAFIELARSNN